MVSTLPIIVVLIIFTVLANSIGSPPFLGKVELRRLSHRFPGFRRDKIKIRKIIGLGPTAPIAGYGRGVT